jgi:hypothetical protein
LRSSCSLSAAETRSAWSYAQARAVTKEASGIAPGYVREASLRDERRVDDQDIVAAYSSGPVVGEAEELEAGMLGDDRVVLLS